MSRNVHIVGTGTIGEPLTRVFIEMKDSFGIDRVSFHKANALTRDRSKVWELTRAGAILAAYQESVNEGDDRHMGIADFENIGMHPQISAEQAIDEADVVIDCTPVGNRIKEKIYQHIKGPKLFLAQGSEFGFGKPYARGINDETLIPGKDRYIQIVSCNTHVLSTLINTFGMKNGFDPDNFVEGDFVCNRRSSDTSETKIAAGIVVENHNDAQFGTHHARDAYHLFATRDIYLNNIFSSAVKLPTQYMHAVRFRLTVRDKTTTEDLVSLIEANDRLAVTHKTSTNEVFSFGRDHGFYGRIFNQAVIPHSTLHVGKSKDGYKISGHAFVPQDGNSLLSSTAATLWHFDPKGYGAKTTGPLQAMSKYFRREI